MATINRSRVNEGFSRIQKGVADPVLSPALLQHLKTLLASDKVSAGDLKQAKTMVEHGQNLVDIKMKYSQGWQLTTRDLRQISSGLAEIRLAIHDAEKTTLTAQIHKWVDHAKDVVFKPVEYLAAVISIAKNGLRF